MEANHNVLGATSFAQYVAYDIAKIYIWKQITTDQNWYSSKNVLLMILQRYTFGSKSQHSREQTCYNSVAYDIAKIYIWKQITTKQRKPKVMLKLLMILQRYTFGSKSQQISRLFQFNSVAYDIAKIGNFSQKATP